MKGCSYSISIVCGVEEAVSSDFERIIFEYTGYKIGKYISL